MSLPFVLSPVVRGTGTGFRNDIVTEPIPARPSCVYVITQTAVLAGEWWRMRQEH